jgi:hypothetical protein
MATELDKFVISLAFDVNKLQESTAKVSNTITKMIGGIDKSFKTLMSTFAVGFSLNMAKNLVEGFAKVGSGLEFASESLRVNVTQLNAWQEMAKRVGGTAEGMTSAFSNMQNAIIGADFTGGNPVVMALQQMGIATKDSKGNMRDLVSIFADINKAFQKFTPDQQLKMSKILGVDPATQRLLSLSTSKFKEQMSEVERAGLITKAQAEEATRAKVRWDNLNQTWDRIKFNLGERLYPIFEKITTWVLKFAQNDLPRLIDKLSAFKNSIGLSNDVLIKLGVGFTVFAGVATTIGGITLAVGALTTTLLTAVAPLAALGLGYQALSEVQINKGKGFIPNLTDTAKNATDPTFWQKSLQGSSVSKGVGFVQNLKNTWQQAIDWVTGAQAQKESGNNPNAVGDKGKSFGTFQMQKGTAKDILGYEPTSNQLKDPTFNKMLRDKYMALGMEKSGGDIKGALAFYNGGYKGLDYWKRTGKTLNNYGEDILANSINSARLNPRASTSNKTSNTTVSIGNVAMHGVQDPKGMYDNLNSYIPVVHDSGRLA